jgi:hypothetical protein
MGKGRGVRMVKLPSKIKCRAKFPVYYKEITERKVKRIGNIR